MKITPLEIRQHEFEKTFRGYNIEEVDGFLANLSQEWDRVLNESKMLRMQLEIAEKEANKLREIEMTLFKTLKTAEDTSKMITDQASQQGDKHVQEAKLNGEKALIDAQQKAAEIIRQAENRAKYIKDEVLGDVKVLERDFRAMDHYKTNLLVQMRSLSNATLEHVQRFEDKFDKEGVDAKFKEATSMLTDEDEVVAKEIETPQVEALVEEIAQPVVEEISAEIPSITPETLEEVVENEAVVAEPVVEIPAVETLVEEEIPTITEVVAVEEVKEIIPVIEEPVIAETILPSSINNLVETVDNEVVTVNETAKSDEPKTDELDIIEGIGPKIAMLLYDAGIFTFRDLAVTPVYKIEEILEAAGPQFARHDPTTWTQQAKLAAEGRWDDLEALKGFLIRGKAPVETAEEVAAATPIIEDFAPAIEAPVEVVKQIIEEKAPEINVAAVIENHVEEVPTPIAAVVDTPVFPVVENNLDSITEEMLEKVNKVKAAIRKAMVEKNDTPTKDTSPLPTLNDVMGKANEGASGGSFFDNI